MEQKQLPLIAIVGRPNVGKSSLFNALLRRRVSIVHEQAGVTRDPIMSRCSWGGRDFMLVDTGGLGVGVKQKNKVELFDGLIREQVLAIAQEAYFFILVVNLRDGITEQDREVANFVRTLGKEVILVVNKADNPELEEAAEHEFVGLGFEKIVPTSCIQKTGITALMETALEILPPVVGDPEPEAELKLAVIGRENVGKSSLVNAMIGEQRVMVSDIAGTTRDAVDIPLTLATEDGDEVALRLIDTAGLRKRKSVDTMVDYFSKLRTERTLQRADVVLFVIDCMNPGGLQDRKIARMIADLGKPCLLIANKWDLMMEQAGSRREFLEYIRDVLGFMSYAPVITVSALNGYRVDKIADYLLALREQMTMMISTAVLNRFLQDVISRTPPPTVNGKRLKIYYGTMVSNPPAKFALFINTKKSAAAHYIQFLENKLREAFFPESGLPIILQLREREDPNDQRNSGARAAAIGAKRKEEESYQRVKRYHERRKGYRKK